MKLVTPLFALALLAMILPWCATAQTGIGTTTPHASSRLEVYSTTRGQLVPRMTTAQRDVIERPAQGLLIYNTDQECFNFFDALANKWQGMGCEANPNTVSGVLDCASATVAGTYTQGTPLTEDEYISIVLNVTDPGYLNLSGAANGMVFSFTGNITSTGVQTIRLAGTGTPTQSGATLVPISFPGSDCSVVVNVSSAVATLAGCGTAGAPSVALTAGTPIAGSTVTLSNLSYTGGARYTLTASTANGISIAPPYSGTLGASPATLVLPLSGTPLAPGNTVISYSINNQTACSLTLPVSSGTARGGVGCGGALSGAYTSGTATTAANTKVVTVTAGVTGGTFTLRTNTVNGIYFEGGPVTLNALTAANVTLHAVGTPVSAGTFTYSLSVNATLTTFSTCTFNVTVAAPVGGPDYTAIVCGVPGAPYTYLKASNTNGADHFGEAVAVSDNGLTMAVGADLENGSGNGVNPASNNLAPDAGAVYIYSRATVGSVWAFQAYIKASNNDLLDDHFGRSVALSADGNTLAVGANLEDGSGAGVNPIHTNLAPNAGAAYIYSRSGSTWTFQAYLKAPNPNSGDQFGWSVSLSNDGNTLGVGATMENGSGTGINPTPNNLTDDAGAVYVYTRTGSTWTYDAYLKASNTGTNDYFGWSVAVSGDGNTLAVGTYSEDGSGNGINPASNNDATDAGATYVYTRSGGAWSFQAYLKAANSGVGDYFGRSVGLSTDGNTLVVGAPLEDGSGTTVNAATDNGKGNSGAAYVFSRSGSTWTQHAYLKAMNNTFGGDQFGTAVAVSGDGNSVAVGAPFEDGSNNCINNANTNSNANAGAGYVYFRTGGTWLQTAYVKGGNSGTADNLGIAVSLSDNGKVLGIGAYLEDGNGTGINPPYNNATLLGDAGAAYVYTAP